MPEAGAARLIKPRSTKEAPISVSASQAVPATRSPLFLAAFAIAITSAATILGAYFFQYVMGLSPCPLCLQQRIPYYIAIPFGLVLAVAILAVAINMRKENL